MKSKKKAIYRNHKYNSTEQVYQHSKALEQRQYNIAWTVLRQSDTLQDQISRQGHSHYRLLEKQDKEQVDERSIVAEYFVGLFQLEL